MRAAILALAASACSFPTKTLEMETPFGCLNQPLPTTAPARVTISGSVVDPYQGIPIASATLQGFLTSAPQTPLFTIQTDSNGMFSQGQGTGGVPTDAFLHITANGSLDTVEFPAVPVADNITIDAQMFTSTELGTLAMVAGVTADPTKALIIVSVVDCNDAPLVGATVTTTPAGETRYLVNRQPSASAVATDPTGVAFIYNLPPSTTQINAMVNGMTLRSHSVLAQAGLVTQTEIQP